MFIVQGNETEGLQAARGRLACWRQKLGHTANDTVACPKCHFHNVTMLKSFRQDQQSASGGEFVQQASNGLTAFRTNCNANRARNPYAPCPLGWIWLRKIGHYWRICHPSPEPTRLPKGVADRVAPLGCIFGALSPTVITSELQVSRYKGSQLMKPGVLTSLRRLFAGTPVSERNGDFTPTVLQGSENT